MVLEFCQLRDCKLRTIPKAYHFKIAWQERINDWITWHKQEATIRHTILHLHFSLGNLVTATEEFQVSLSD